MRNRGMGGFRKHNGLRGAHTLEYAILIGVVAAAMVAMQTYVRRAVQAHLKMIEVQLNAGQ